MNLSRSTVSTSRNIKVWCGPNPDPIQTFSNLAPVAYQLMEVLDTCIDPCDLEFFATNNSGNITIDFNSGAFNVNSVKAATPTTWGANDLNSACPTFYTGGTLIPTATNTV